MTDRIEKTVELKAPVARVWRALTDHHEFGQWFRVRLEGPFVPGQIARGQITHPGYEHLVWEAVVQRMEPERLFSFTWHPYAIDPNQDYSGEEPTLVEFTLDKSKMKFKANGKSYEYMVVGQAAATPAAAWPLPALGAPAAPR